MPYSDHNSSSVHIPLAGPPIHIHDEFDESSASDPEEPLPLNHQHLATRTPFVASPSTSPNLGFQVAERISNHNLLYPHNTNYALSHSSCSTASVTPLPSRSASPIPLYVHSSSCSSGSDSEPESPLLLSDSLRRDTSSTWRQTPRWWQVGGSRRRRRRESFSWFRAGKRMLRKLIRHPFVPKTPLTIILTLLLLTAFGVSLTFLLIYILNPDKEPLPWRGYCTIPSMSYSPPPSTLPPTASFPHIPPQDFGPPSFPPENFDSIPPAGVFVGVFSVDTAVERRMMIRSMWASHARSRNGAGEGDDGVGTSRTVVRFILGQPRRDWERRIRLEMETYKDMVILPIAEKMNDGKTHAFFTWAASDAWVPPLYFDDMQHPTFSYSNVTIPAPILASHDPAFAQQDSATEQPRRWVRPDFVVKADDDAFVMLAELEARLRLELHKAVNDSGITRQSTVDGPESSVLARRSPISSAGNVIIPASTGIPSRSSGDMISNDPLIYWGYLVKNRFMAGELYALSFSIVDWLAKDPQVKTMTRGAEDKQTSKWIRIHPRASEVRWASERCWIYDHPRAGTVYSHGFLFPSEVKRVQRDIKFDLEHHASQSQHVMNTDSSLSGFQHITPFGPYGTPPASWSRSTVSTFGVRYSSPTSDLTAGQSIEALVEGSEMSRLRDGAPGAADYAWRYREGRHKRYDGKRIGGTVVVHFIKKNLWFLEAALALLEGVDVTDAERIAAEELSRPTSTHRRLDHSTGKPHIVSSSSSSVIVSKNHRPH
ncbi:hypothetical protein C8Q75DRAFT_719845 [Abortiporus biennis]|nr:hypothetical protein C8Q75DRAFT_719845 [Abortiporus biennis]